MKTYDNFLDINLVNQINSYVEQVKFEPMWKTSHGWSSEIKRKTNPVAILPLPDKFTSSIHEQLKKTAGLTWKDDKLPRGSQYYLYPSGGSIGWHTDGGYEFAAMIFLNPVWSIEWGGLFLYEDSEGLGIRAEVPAFNRCLINPGGVPHGVSITAPDAPLRRVIVTFGPLADDKETTAIRRKESMEWREKRNMDVVNITKEKLGDVGTYLHIIKDSIQNIDS